MILNIIVALFLGFVAGIIDAIPMIKMGIPKPSVIMVFSQWVFISLVIPFIQLGLDQWLTGLIIGLLGMSPILSVLYFRNRDAIPGTIIYGLVLGAGLGFSHPILIHILTKNIL